MSDTTNKAERLQFLKIDSATGDTLREFRPLLEKTVQGVLGKFYDHLARYPDLVKLFGGEANIARARGAQATHWLGIFEGRFDDSYVERVRRIGKTHERIGLEPRWYIGGYSLAMGELIAVAVQEYRRKPEKLTSTLQSIVKALFLDMDYAISIYIEEGKINFQKRLNELADGCEANVKTIVEKALSRDRTQRFATAKEMLDALVIESNGVLPISMKSDSMKRPRAGSGTSSSGSSPGAMRSPGPATLGAVSTVAVTPEPLKPTTPGKGSRAPFAVGAIAIAAGGVFAGVWLSDDRTDGRGLRAVPSASAQTDPSAEASGVLSTPVASDSAPVNRAVASVTVEPAGSVAASATASAVATQTSKVRPPEVRSGAVSAVKTAAPTSTGGLGTGLQLKKE